MKKFKYTNELVVGLVFLSIIVLMILIKVLFL